MYASFGAFRDVRALVHANRGREQPRGCGFGVRRLYDSDTDPGPAQLLPLP